MEEFFYLTVKVLSLVFILYKTYRFLFGQAGKNRWQFLTPKVRNKKESTVPQNESGQSACSIVGKTQTVYLKEPAKEHLPEPVFSEDLQKFPAYQEEADISSEEVESNLDEEILTEEERFTLLDIEPDSEMLSTGMSYEQISQALEVVQGKNTNKPDKLAAARTLYEVQGSELFDFLASQAENEAMIERLLKENLDNAGGILPENEKKKRKETAEFDMGKYV